MLPRASELQVRRMQRLKDQRYLARVTFGPSGLRGVCLFCNGTGRVYAEPLRPKNPWFDPTEIRTCEICKGSGRTTITPAERTSQINTAVALGELSPSERDSLLSSFSSQEPGAEHEL
jgi:hypothetical protein